MYLYTLWISLSYKERESDVNGYRNKYKWKCTKMLSNVKRLLAIPNSEEFVFMLEFN